MGKKQSKYVLPNQSQSARDTIQVGVQQPTPSGSNVSQQTSVVGTTMTPQQTQVGVQQPTPSCPNVSQQTTPVRQLITNYVFRRHRKATVVDDEIQMAFSLVFVRLLIRCEVVM
ncbi:hypothetical protein LSAT2_031793 [Lamellibrachia satsuma]|nr:hypothetical protein LSAT2_031793 [Lamellibrachia satsuma]